MNRDRRLALFAVLLLGALPYALPLLEYEVFSFRDHESYFVPLRYFTAEALRSGEIPLWNPFNGSGERWLANPQTGIFYPPAWIFLVLPFPTAYVTFLLLHSCILGAGALLLFNRYASLQAALFGATALMFAGPILSGLDVNNNLTTFAWVPIAIWCASAARRRGGNVAFDDELRGSDIERRGSLAFVVSPLVLAMMFLGGEPALALLGWIAYTFAFFSPHDRWSRVGDFVRIGFLALLLISPQLVPFMESLRESDRSHGLSREAALSESLSPGDWLSVTVPRLSRSNVVEPFRSSQAYLVSFYIGVVPVLLAQVALITSLRLSTSRSRMVTVGWVALISMSVVLSAGRFAPVLGRHWELLHLNANRYPARVALFAVLALAGLASLGYDRWGAVSMRARWASIGGTILVTMSGFLLFQPVSGSIHLRLLVAILWIVAAALLAVRPHQFPARRGFIAVLCFLTVTDLWFSARPLLETRVFNPRSEQQGVVGTTRKVMRVKVHGRRDAAAWLDGYLNLPDRIMDVDSAGPVRPQRYLRLLESINARPRVDIIDFLSVGYLLTDGTVPPQFTALKESRGVGVYKNESSLPLVGLWPTWVVAASGDEAFEQFLSAGNDARQSLYLSGRGAAPPLTKRGDHTIAASGSLKRFALNYVAVQLSAPAPSVLSITQLDAAGWRVTVDGRREKPLRANGLFRAVMVPAGAHKVEWTYRPMSLVAGLLFGLVGCCVMAIELALHRRADSP
ncbi:MAG TPA: YfhO family protein [Thermoanaerobaculia bacterium]|nr:YfhO family protein [Thermoanaerobaculia bacterium]